MVNVVEVEAPVEAPEAKFTVMVEIMLGRGPTTATVVKALEEARS